MRYTITFVLASLVAAGAVRAEVPRVLTDIPPVHALAAQVMGDLGTPEVLLEPGMGEHDLQLKPSQAAGLGDTDLVVWIGAELTPALDRALAGVPANVTRLGLLAADGTITQGYADGDGIDPHAWLKPANAAIWVMVIAGELGRLDPENAATYAANATAAVAGITALDGQVAAILAPVQDLPIVVAHDAIGYFASHYDLTIAGTIAAGDATTPGAARVADLRAMVKGGGAVCIFPEVGRDAAMALQIVDGTATKVGGALDPVGAGIGAGPGMYAALLTGMAQTIADCAGQG